MLTGRVGQSKAFYKVMVDRVVRAGRLLQGEAGTRELFCLPMAAPALCFAVAWPDGKVTVWLPKSQAEWGEANKTMQMPEWLAFERGLI